MRRWWAAAAVVGLVGLAPGRALAAGPSAPGVPTGAPAVAGVAERALPAAPTWPFAESFPHTSGTSRLVPGALEASDFVYDDHGAVGGPPATGATGSSAGTGSYTYADGPAHGDGADIWRTGIGLDATASWWRVDWTTLDDPAVPLAVFGLDTDADPATGTAAWPAGAGVSSAGLERAIVMGAHGASLLDLTAGTSVALPAPVVDRASHSFVLRVPRTALPVSGAWTVRLLAGLADGTGAGFAPVPGGSLPGQPRVFNVGFRTIAQEAPAHNAGFDSAQAQALTSGDVSAFSTRVSWPDLAAGTATPEPRPTGISARWLISALDLGYGVVPNDPALNDGVQDFRPNILGRVQPYTVYVPTTYDPARPPKLTWVLHELSNSYTQYSSGPASYLQQLCEDRYSLCVTPEGRGPDMYYYDEAEEDFWEVWNRVGATYSLDLEHTIVTGFSMGACGSYRLALAYPDLFAEAVPMAGLTAAKAFRFLIPGAVAPGSPEVYEQGQFSPRLEANGDQDRLLENARWLRLFIVHGGRDELVPVSQAVELARQLEALGQRVRLQVHPAEGHTDWAIKGTYGAVVAQLSGAARATDPGHVTYSWWPAINHPEWGMVQTGAFWIKDVTATSRADGTLARIDATSLAHPDPAVTTQLSESAVPSDDPSPGVATEQTWALGPRPAARNELVLSLSHVASLRVDEAGARLDVTRTGQVRITSDAPATLHLAGRSFALPQGASTIDLPLTASTRAVPVRAPRVHRSVPPRAPATALAATGTDELVTLAAALMVGAGLGLRRRSALAD